ncbi:golgin subfamily A member 2-like isoform X2 [Ciona intestinalis]
MDTQREEKIAAAKRKLRQFKQKKHKTKKAPVPSTDENQPNIGLPTLVSDDASSVASEDIVVPVSHQQDIRTHNEKRLDTSRISDCADTKNSSQAKHTDNENVVIHGEHLSLQEEINALNSIQQNNSNNSIGDNNTDIYTNGDSQQTLEENVTTAVNESPYQEKQPVSSSVNTSIYNGNPESNSDMATTESLIQISNKLNELATEAQSVSSNDVKKDDSIVSVLTNRNQELSKQICELTQHKQQLLVQVNQLNHQMREMQVRLEKEEHQLHARSVKEESSLRQQIQVQMQTIGILVAEKQELQHQVHEAQQSSTHHRNSHQRLSEQLQESKRKLQSNDLEMRTKDGAINLLQTTKADIEKEREELQISVNKINKIKEEHKMHASELTQKLAVKESECHELNNELSDLNEKLSMAEVLLQQLSSPSSDQQTQQQLTEMQEERDSLAQKLTEYQQSFEHLTREREQLSRQYEEVNKQKHKQVDQLTEEIDLLRNEREEMLNEQEKLKLVIKDLKEANQELGYEQDFVEKSELAGEMSSKIQLLEDNIDQVNKENEDLNSKLNAQFRNNEQLARLNEELKQRVNELTQDSKDTKTSNEEHERLLEQAHSDKMTISRALTQNKNLKHQLEEMHETFVKLTNDKMELASRLSTYEYKEKELNEEIGKYKPYVGVLEQKLSAIQAEHVQLQNLFQQTQQQLQLKQQDTTDAFLSLREEVSACNETITLLREQNDELKSKVVNLQQQNDDAALESSLSNKTNEQDIPQGGVMSLPQVLAERDFLANQIEEHKSEHLKLVNKLQQLREEKSTTISVNPKYEELSRNMSLLQGRFASVMKGKVEAESRVEDLEHINLQLQNECDTIGEYITLYHNQRQILKQRHNEKDEYVSSMAHEREAMQKKLEKLQSLVLSLLNARGSLKTNLTSTPNRGNVHNSSDADVTSLDDSPYKPTLVDWPDMLEDEEMKQQHISRPDILPEDASLPPIHHAPTNNQHNVPGKLERLETGNTDNETTTANQIVDLIEQMQNPSFMNSDKAPRGFCLRYMGRYTAV